MNDPISDCTIKELRLFIESEFDYLTQMEVDQWTDKVLELLHKLQVKYQEDENI